MSAVVQNGSAIKLLLTGDSMAVRRNAIANTGFASPLRRLLSSVDVAFTNLEVVPTDGRGYPRAGLLGTHLNAPSGVVDDLVRAGFTAFSCANNHTMNFGTEGALAMIEVMKARSLGPSGVGANLHDARMPTYVDGGFGGVALISCSSTFRPGEEAAPQSSGYTGRPGLNPLTVDTVYEVTDAQFTSLQQLSDELGLERARRRSVELGMRLDRTAGNTLEFLDKMFRRAEAPATKMTARESDVSDMERWVREAARRAGVVIVSIHSHEAGPTEFEPPEFLVTFAHRMIDAGATAVVTHGPHYVRGMSIYRDRPIFYSLGNFIAQNDYVDRIPPEAYGRLGLSPDATPADFMELRSAGGTKGFVQRRYWEAIAPVCTFVDGRLAKLEIFPLSLGIDDVPPLKGSPRLADRVDAQRILEDFARMSPKLDLKVSDAQDYSTVSAALAG